MIKNIASIKLLLPIGREGGKGGNYD